MYKAYKAFMRGFLFFEKILTVIMLALVTVLTFGNVLSRYVLPVSWSFTEEIVINLFVGLSLIGAAMLASKEGGLVSMALLNGALPDKGKHILNIIDAILGVVFFIIVFKTGMQRTSTLMMTHQVTDVLRIPMWYFTAAIPVSSVCFFLHYLEYILDNIHAMVHGEEVNA